MKDEVDKAIRGKGRFCGKYKLKLPKNIQGKNLNFATFVLFVIFSLFLVGTLRWVWQDNEEDEKQFLGQKVPGYRAT